MRRRLLLALLTTSLLTPPAAAQCTPIPNTGCPGARGLSCYRPPRLGDVLQAGCTILGTNYLLIGRCLSSPLPIPPAPLCGSPTSCMLSVDPSLHIVLQYHVSAFLPIPNDPGLLGVTLCAQCVSPWCASGQLQVFEAATVTIQG